MWIVVLVAALTLVDQVTKTVVDARMGVGQVIEIVPGLANLRYVRNTGAAWGMLAGMSHWLVVVSLIMLIVLVVFRRRIMYDTRVHRIATGCLIGGIVGNLIDRIKFGYVIDFVDIYWRTHHFPAFNVADAAICVGVGLYVLAPRPGRAPETAPR